MFHWLWMQPSRLESPDKSKLSNRGLMRYVLVLVVSYVLSNLSLVTALMRIVKNDNV